MSFDSTRGHNRSGAVAAAPNIVRFRLGKVHGACLYLRLDSREGVDASDVT